ncbi:MAG: beta-galactosidase [Verrucomicrobia bacterium]|nr:beta-galactosidase [Verrucomicrobiota bacterium]
MTNARPLRRLAWATVPLFLLAHAAQLPTAESRFRVDLPPAPFATELLTNSIFGINTALDPALPGFEEHLHVMQELGVKWARQDFSWRRIERQPGEYHWQPYDQLVDACHARGIQLLGCLAYAPPFHDPRTAPGVEAYAKFAAAAALRYAGRVDHWQIWNEPNGGFWQGSAGDYARLLTAAGLAIRDAHRPAKIVALNMAFCDVLWAGRVLRQVPASAFDIVAFHPYRPPNAPEDPFDWWTLDQYVKVWHGGELPTNYALVNMTFLEQTAELQKVMQQLNRSKPLWVTEICWNTHLHPYGTSELRQADLLVRFHALALGSQQIAKVFWWTLRDQGVRQFDQADMVGLTRFDLSPKYAHAAYGWMTRMLEGKQWVRNDAFGPDIFAVVFTDAAKAEDRIVAWSTRPFAYVRVNNTERGLQVHDLFGTRRFIEFDPLRTASLSLPLGESPIYITGAPGLKAVPKPDPGW